METLTPHKSSLPSPSGIASALRGNDLQTSPAAGTSSWLGSFPERKSGGQSTNSSFKKKLFDSQCKSRGSNVKGQHSGNWFIWQLHIDWLGIEQQSCTTSRCIVHTAVPHHQLLWILKAVRSPPQSALFIVHSGSLLIRVAQILKIPSWECR